VDWSRQPDRQQVLEDLCHRCTWRPNGALVELNGGGTHG
jgi:hypothetical protein